MKLKKWKKLIGMSLLMFFLLFNDKTYASEKGVKIFRIYGDTRYKTANEISKVTFNKSEYAIVVNGDKFADGLTGGVLASMLKAPVLLCEKDFIELDTIKEMNRLNVKKVFILGGESVLSKSLENRLSAMFKVERIYGNNRFETATKVAEKIRGLSNANNNFVGIANGMTFPDALSAGAYLSNVKVPLVLSETLGVPYETVKFFKKNYINQVLIFGGESAIPLKTISKSLKKAVFSGNNRYETAVNIALEGYENPKFAILVSGQKFADALAAAPLSYLLKAPVILTDKTEIDEVTKNYILNSTVENVIVVGGENAVSDSVINIIKKADVDIIYPSNDYFGNNEGEPVG